MTISHTAEQVLDRHYLEIRCELLNLAAALDRVERSAGYAQVAGDERLERLRAGIDILTTAGNDRAERLQLLFSDQYVAGWNR